MVSFTKTLTVLGLGLGHKFIPTHTHKPIYKPIESPSAREFERICNMRAGSEELNLQLGKAYFLADSKEEIEHRIRYELLPLIKEYFRARDILYTNFLLIKYCELFGNER